MTERTAVHRRRKLSDTGADACPPDVLEWWRAGCPAAQAVPWSLLLEPAERVQSWVVQLRAMLPATELPSDLSWLAEAESTR